VVFDDPEGLTHELRVVETSDDPLIAEHPEIPAELALQGFHAVRAYTADPERSRALLEDTLGFVPIPHGPVQSAAYEVRGQDRGGIYMYDPPQAERGMQGAGSVHHVAWASHPDDHEAWHRAVVSAGAHATPIIDRYYFRSIYFREPSGVLFEIATIGPGFTVDEPLDQLGTKLSLTPQYEHLRNQIEPTLTPLRNPRDSWISR
jgi:glyoxalase family protein